MLDLQLADRIVVVTGGASNIGRGIVHAFAEQQALVVLVDIDEHKAKQTAAEALERGARDCVFLPADLSEAENCSRTLRNVVDAFGHVDVLVNNFGWGDPGLLLRTTPDQWQQLWQMNLAATIACSQVALQSMKARHAGNIVAIASDAAQGVPNQSVYGALKAGVIAFTRSVAREFGRFGVRANAVSPGIVFPEAEAAGARSVWNRGATVLTEEQIQATIEQTALRRPTVARDIANAVLFLASDAAARQVTGQHFSVGGGWWMP
ncbi:MAG: SDR family oxidoreductase [Pseudomonadales bacterium]|nr:SDR family oxidoreductase [Pseudomonadales bacterium]